MGRPRLIIIVRHAQSEGNKNREIHQTIPDHRVKLTKEGWTQANDAGRRLRKLLNPDDRIQVFTSPYRRTRETTEGLLATLTSDEPGPSPFQRKDIKVYEEPRLREQDFGNFQPCSAEMERMWQERADYGHFFYRIPNGESAADAYDRVSGFNDSLWRQFGEDDFPSVCILVTHGLMSRVFLMKWYHFTVEHFEDLRNIDHCEFLTMRRQEDGKYLLENKLRTWSGLRKERAGSITRIARDKESLDNGDQNKHDRFRPVVVTRRWGGCPNGCNHSNHYKKRHDLDALRQKDDERNGGHNGVSNGNSLTIASRRQRHKSIPSLGDGDDERSDNQTPSSSVVGLEVARILEDIVSSPDGTPSFITAEDRARKPRTAHFHFGRDFGGTYSGHTSAANSDGELSCDEGPLAIPRRNVTSWRRPSHNGKRPSDSDATSDGSFTKKRCATSAYATRLGNASITHGTSSSDTEDLDRAEREDRSIAGSVY
ncbi:phosphoglycerate mutase family domain protein [Moelleriella libera RCEF 2490]|uniref:Phosphoglycerate mutase family domain protein n=1 Tax=Moelleriella libera RCEF 2490 TaxID=1081109 RepID=A0A168EAS7_9HYPO|nr:phosphoglycerate mutase family domain protein [Moelleriella libera RCEF 2490]